MKCHVAPQFYLRRWAYDGPHKWVRALDLQNPSAVWEGARVKDIAWELDLYELSDAVEPYGLKTTDLERRFISDLEYTWSEATARTIESGTIRPDDLHTLAELLSFQMARRPEIYEYFEVTFGRLDHKGELYLRIFQDVRFQDFIKDLASQIMVLGNSGSQELLTSDRPAMAIDSAPPPSLTVYPGAIFSFPLSPNQCLLIYDRSNLSSMARYEGSTMNLARHFVDEQNGRQVRARSKVLVAHDPTALRLTIPKIRGFRRRG